MSTTGWRLAAAAAAQCAAGLAALYELAIAEHELVFPELWDEEAGTAYVAEQRREAREAVTIAIRKAREASAELAEFVAGLRPGADHPDEEGDE